MRAGLEKAQLELTVAQGTLAEHKRAEAKKIEAMQKTANKKAAALREAEKDVSWWQNKQELAKEHWKNWSKKYHVEADLVVKLEKDEQTQRG